jgi:hypothetical protein
MVRDQADPALAAVATLIVTPIIGRSSSARSRSSSDFFADRVYLLCTMRRYMRTATSIRVMSAVGALVLVACDDSAEHPACEAFVACGGDVVGVWQIADACVKKPAPGPAPTASSPEPGLDECSPTSVSERVTPLNATLELSGDGEYWASGELASRVAYTYSRPCLQDRFNPARPDVVCSASISQTGPDPMDCVSDRASCRCSMERSMNIASTGRYEIRGTRIAFDGQPAQAYCIDGAEAQLDHPGLGKLYLERNDRAQ